jgi:hypothetical protein
MPLQLEEKRTRGIPRGCTLLIKVVSTFSTVNATGRVDDPNDDPTNITHAAIFNRVKRMPLSLSGLYISRVHLIFNASTEQAATVEYSIEDRAGAEIRKWQPQFSGRSNGEDKFLGRAKWSISVD